jgi:tetratricopeptide (TPR) repeat protein
VAPDFFLFLLTLPAAGLLGGALLGVVLAWVPWPLLLGAAAVPLALFAHSVFSGPKASRTPGRLLWEAAIVAGSLFLLHATRRLPALAARPRVRWAAGAAAMLVAAFLHRADATLYVGTYGQIHAALALAAAGLSMLGAGLMGLAVPLPSLRLLFVLAAALLFRGAWSLGGSDRLRWTLRRHAPVAGKLSQTMDRAFRRVPPAGSPELLAAVLPGPDGQRATRAAALDGHFPDRGDADVVLITIDALRPDRLGTYGANRGATPHLDRLARESVHFPETRAQYPGTRFSLASLFRSLYPACTPEYCFSFGRPAPGNPAPLLAERLRAAGWNTAAFFCQEPRDLADPGLYAFFTAGIAHVGNVYQGSFHFTTGPIVEAARVWLRSRPPGRAFLWIYLDEAHHPYTGQPDHPFGPSDEDRYLSEIATVDEGVGSILETIRATERLGRTVVVVHADHGEEFGEHGGRQHLTTAYEEQVRVPLLFRVPGLRAGAAPAHAALVDVAPTLMEVVGLAPDPALQGRSLVPQLLDPAVPLERPVFSQVDPYSVTANRLRAVTSGGWKLIHDLDADLRELYDPGERRNLAGTGQAREPGLEALLRTFESLPCLASQEPAPPPAAAPAPRRTPEPVAAVAGPLAELAGKDPVRRVRAALALAEEAPPEALEALRGAARDPVPQLRAAATYALAAHGERGDEKELLPFLTSGDERLCFVAWLGLALLGRPELRFALTEALGRHDAAFVKVALRRIGDAPAPGDLPGLRVAARDGALPLPLRAAALQAIARLDHPDAVRALARFERDATRPLAVAARAALETRPVAAVAAARAAAEHEDEAAEVEWQGDFARAQKLYRKALAADPGNGDALMSLTRLLWNLGREQEAFAALEAPATEGGAARPRAGALAAEALRRAAVNGGTGSASLALSPPAFERVQRSGERVVAMVPVRNLSPAPQLGFSLRSGLTLRWTVGAPDGARSEAEVEVPFPVYVLEPDQGVVLEGAFRPPAGPGIYDLAFELRAGSEATARCDGGVMAVVAAGDRAPWEALAHQLRFEVEGAIPAVAPGGRVDVPVRIRYRGPLRVRGGDGPGSLALWPVFADPGESGGKPVRFPPGPLEPGAEVSAVLELRASALRGSRRLAFQPELVGIGHLPPVDWTTVQVGP